MPTSLIVVDDFLDRAGALREAGLRLSYPEQDGAFPGRNSLQRIEIANLANHVSHIVGEPLRVISPLGSHAKFRITLADDVGRGRVHTDPGYFSGVLGLSRPEDCRGGTDFFRHKRTGTERRPLDPVELQATGYSSIDELDRDVIERDSMRDEAWERTMSVPMRFNRLILLRPWLWHTAGPGFGKSLEDGRLVYLMFFERA
ncbi:MAG: DUF6445 family protein [Pseudoxanthomonas suwonensis]|nr:DUF6445 family protein [Pseudoxanthomonas suwonensis]